jgi:hypothetical protein
MTTRIDPHHLAADIARRYRARKVLARVIGVLGVIVYFALTLLAMYGRGSAP